MDSDEGMNSEVTPAQRQPRRLHSRSALAAESIFSVMSRLAAQHGAVNLGQGFPAGSPPAFLLDALKSQAGTADQYTAPAGLPALREALALDLNAQPEQITVTCGATEALHTLADALYGAGTSGQPEEVLMLDRKSTRLNSSHRNTSRMPSSA